MLVEGRRIGAPWVHNKCTGTREARNLHRVLNGVAEQRCAQAKTLEPLVHTKHAQKNGGNLLGGIARKPFPTH